MQEGRERNRGPVQVHLSSAWIEHTPIPGTVAYAEWRRGLYLLVNVLLSNGLGTGYNKKYLVDIAVRKTLLTLSERGSG